MKKIFLVTFLLVSIKISVAQQFEVIDPTKHELLNKEMPLFKGQTLDGKEFNLLDNRGKITLLTFWTLNCGACFKEIAEINIINKNYKDRNVMVVSIMPDSSKAVLKQIRVGDGNYILKKKAFLNDEINYQIVPGMREYILKCLPMESYPMMFIIDKKGILREFSSGYRLSLFDPATLEETENYKVMKEGIERLINEK